MHLPGSLLTASWEVIRPSLCEALQPKPACYKGLQRRATCYQLSKPKERQCVVSWISPSSLFKLRRESPFQYHMKKDDQTGIRPKILHPETSQPWLHALSHIAGRLESPLRQRGTPPLTTCRKEPLLGLSPGLCLQTDHR